MKDDLKDDGKVEKGKSVQDPAKLQPTKATFSKAKQADQRAAERLRKRGAIYSRMPMFATTRRGQAADNFKHAYLTDNRFEWWNLAAFVPPTDAIRRNPDDPDAIHTNPDAPVPTPRSTFQRQFYSSLATAVGARLGFLEAEFLGDGFPNFIPRARMIPWETMTTPASLNLLPGIDFYVSATPTGAALLDSVNLVQTPTQIALVNPVREPNSEAVRSITLNFIVPQRAVGLECGFLADSEEFINADSFELIARDADGLPIITSAGSALDNNNWLNNRSRFIGVVNAEGRITSVELLCTDPNFTADKRLFITRIWYECLPPAVTLQGTLCNVAPEVFANLQHPGHPDVLTLRATVAADADLSSGSIRQSPATFTLPYHCDSAVVMLRGFKLTHEDASATKVARLVSHLSYLLQGTTLWVHFAGELSRGHSPGGFNEGVIGEPGDGPRPQPSDVTVGGAYYTIVAWDSTCIDLHSSAAETSEAHEGNQYTHLFELPNRHPDAGRVTGNAEERMGPLLGAMRGMRLEFDTPQEIQGLALMAGNPLGDDAGGNIHWDEVGPGLALPLLGALVIGAPALAATAAWVIGFRGAVEAHNDDLVFMHFPPLAYSDFGRKIRWSWASDMRDTASSSDRVRSRLSGFVLNGKSLGQTFNTTALEFDTDGEAVQRKLQSLPFFEGGGITEFPLTGALYPIPVDMAIMGLGQCVFIPEDDLHELDVEVRGYFFDGRSLIVEVGGGLDLMPSTDDGRFVLGIPLPAGLSRISAQVNNHVSTQGIHFRTPARVVALAPVQHGAIRNEGNVPMLLIAMELVGDAKDEYNLKIDYRGTIIELSDIATRDPLVLQPGEVVVIGGAFYWEPRRGRPRPDDDDNRRPPPGSHADFHQVTLQVRTNQPGYSYVEIPVSAEIVPSDADASIFPAVINFGNFDIYAPDVPRQPRERGALVTSDGSTPVFVTAITIEPPLQAFQWRVVDVTASTSAASAIYVLDPGTSLHIAVFFNPDQPGFHTATLRIDTNTGQLTVPLRGDGIRPVR